MDNTKDDKYYITSLIENVDFICKHLKDINIEEFKSNELLQDSMSFRLIQISEISKRLSEEFRNRNQSIPWGDIYGLRNRIVHDYGNVDMHIVFSTVKYDIPNLLETLHKCK